MSCKTSRSRGLKLCRIAARASPLLTRRAMVAGEIMLSPRPALRTASMTLEAGSDLSTYALAPASTAARRASSPPSRLKNTNRVFGNVSRISSVASRAVVEVEVHDDYVRRQSARQRGRLVYGARLADDIHVTLTVEEETEA